MVSSPSATRHSCSCSMRRYSHSCTRCRHSSSHCCSPERAHGLGRLCLHGCKDSLFFSYICEKQKKSTATGGIFEIPCIEVDSFVIHSFALRYFACRLVSRYARRFDDLAAEGQTRPEVRIRIRCVVIRIRVRNTAIRIRMIGRPTRRAGVEVSAVAVP